MKTYGTTPVIMPKSSWKKVNEGDILVMTGLKGIHYFNNYLYSGDGVKIPTKFKKFHKDISALDQFAISSEDEIMGRMTSARNMFIKDMTVNHKGDVMTDAFKKYHKSDEFLKEAVNHCISEDPATIYNMSNMTIEYLGNFHAEVHNYKYDIAEHWIFDELGDDYKLMTPHGCRVKYMKHRTTNESRETLRDFTRMCAYDINYEAILLYGVNYMDVYPCEDTLVYILSHLLLRSYRHESQVSGYDTNKHWNENNKVSSQYIKYLKRICTADSFSKLNHIIHKLSCGELRTNKANISTACYAVGGGDNISINLVEKVIHTIHDIISYSPIDRSMHERTKSLF